MLPAPRARSQGQTRNLGPLEPVKGQPVLMALAAQTEAALPAMECLLALGDATAAPVVLVATATERSGRARGASSSSSVGRLPLAAPSRGGHAQRVSACSAACSACSAPTIGAANNSVCATAATPGLCPMATAVVDGEGKVAGPGPTPRFRISPRAWRGTAASTTAALSATDGDGGGTQ